MHMQPNYHQGLSTPNSILVLVKRLFPPFRQIILVHFVNFPVPQFDFFFCCIYNDTSATATHPFKRAVDNAKYKLIHEAMNYVMHL